MLDIPRVLLLGDSIRMSYQPDVTRLLDGKAEVVGPADNCQYSLYTLSSLDRWISALGQLDIAARSSVFLHPKTENPKDNIYQNWLMS